MTLLLDTLVGHSCRTLLWDTLVGHSDTLLGHFNSAKRAFRTRFPPKFTRQYSNQNERFARDFLKNSRFDPAKLSHETSSKSHMSRSPKGAEHFVRDFLQKSSGNPHSTHIKQPCQEVSRFQPLPTTPAHTPIPMSQRHSPPPQLVTSQFPAPDTKNLRVHMSHTHSTAPATKCPRNVTSAAPGWQPHLSLRLPRKSHFHTSKSADSTAPATKSDNIISRHLHHTTRLE